MRKAILVLLTTIFVMGLAACQKPAKSSAPAGPAWPGKMALMTDPAQPISGQDTTFRVTLADPAGQPMSGVKVQADLKMQIMDMGKNVVQLADKGNGLYEGKGQFSMTGPWNVIVSANGAGSSGEQRFEVVVRK